MHVIVFGFRGFPGVEGGIETHAENLYPLMVKLGCDVEVLVRSAYLKKENLNKWQGVRFRALWAPDFQVKRLEALVHSFICVLYAAFKRPQLLHIHGGAASLMVPLARLFGLRVVVTNHGPDYESEKWGFFARWILRIGESLGMRFSNRRIAVSSEIRKIIRKKYKCDAAIIPNGVRIPKIPDTKNTLQQFGLKPRSYVLLVSRFAEHKRHLNLIRAFVAAKLPGWKLVLVGAYDVQDKYSKSVISLARKVNNIVLTNFQKDLPLQELYANAGVFVLPSSYEGLPIALLEALSYGILVLASDIPAHLEIGLGAEQYFPLGDSEALSTKLKSVKSLKANSKSREELRRWVKQNYNWLSIAQKTLEVYTSIPKSN